MPRDNILFMYMGKTTLRIVVAGAAVAVLLAGCSGSDSAPSVTGQAQPSTESSTSATVSSVPSTAATATATPQRDVIDVDSDQYAEYALFEGCPDYDFGADPEDISDRVKVLDPATGELDAVAPIKVPAGEELSDPQCVPVLHEGKPAIAIGFTSEQKASGLNETKLTFHVQILATEGNEPVAMKTFDITGYSAPELSATRTRVILSPPSHDRQDDVVIGLSGDDLEEVWNMPGFTSGRPLDTVNNWAQSGRYVYLLSEPGTYSVLDSETGDMVLDGERVGDKEVIAAGDVLLEGGWQAESFTAHHPDGRTVELRDTHNANLRNAYLSADRFLMVGNGGYDSPVSVFDLATGKVLFDKSVEELEALDVSGIWLDATPAVLFEQSGKITAIEVPTNEEETFPTNGTADMGVMLDDWHIHVADPMSNGRTFKLVRG